MNCSRKSNVILKNERLVQPLTNTRDYDIQGTNTVPQGLKAKATQLNEKATELKNTPGLAAADQVQKAAGNLSDSAGQLNTQAAGNIKGTGLSDLQSKAEALSSGAKGPIGDKTSLHYHATDLSKDQHDAPKAIAVINAFGKVKAAHDELANDPTYKQLLEEAGESPAKDSAEQKVKAVDDAWTQVNTQFETLCKALIKEFANEVKSNATPLKTNVSVTNAQAFKNEYDAFKDIANSTIKITENTDDTGTKTIKVTNLPHINDTFKAKQVKYHITIIPSIVSQWLNFLTYVLLLFVYVMGGVYQFSSLLILWT